MTEAPMYFSLCLKTVVLSFHKTHCNKTQTTESMCFWSIKID